MILAECLVVLYADHVRFHPCHPYIESLVYRLSNRESTDSLIEGFKKQQIFREIDTE